MGVVLSMYGSRWDTEAVVGLAVRLRDRGAEIRVRVPSGSDLEGHPH